MGKFEFVSFNKNAPRDAVCFGEMVFKYNGRICKTHPGFLAPHNTLDTCTVKVWTVDDVAWGLTGVDIMDEDKLLFLKMIVDNVTPIVSKCSLCSNFVEMTDETHLLEHQINACPATIP